MNERELFNYRRLPGRLDVVQAAFLLGFLPHEIPVPMGLSGLSQCDPFVGLQRRRYE
jgi:hypothetical protein